MSTTKTYRVSVIERAIAYYEVEALDASTAAENWYDGQYLDRDDEVLETEGPCDVLEYCPDGKRRKVPQSEWMTPSDIVPFDDYEIHGVREHDEGTGKYCEQVPDEDAAFWSLYGHIPGQGLECIGDFKSRQHAEEVYRRITGRPYGRTS